MTGFIVTWDVDSKDTVSCSRLRRFIFGHSVKTNGKEYHYPGFVERVGVRYLGQSVLFVSASDVTELRTLLETQGIDHVVMTASLGSILPS